MAALKPATAAEKIIVFAASSLKTALDAVTTRWAAETGGSAAISYAASSALARQIEQGAPADLFISADLDWMGYLSLKQLIQPDTEIALLGNRLVLIAPSDSPIDVTIAADFPLAALLGGGKLAMADVTAVPAGKYGKAALEALGVWDAVRGAVAQAENVRAALKLVAAGEAALGIVYHTDAVAEPGVRILGEFPSASHPPVIYPAALVAQADNRAAQGFLTFLRSAKAREIFEAYGFSFLPAPAG